MRTCKYNSKKTPYIVIIALVLILIISILTIPVKKRLGRLQSAEAIETVTETEDVTSLLPNIEEIDYWFKDNLASWDSLIKQYSYLFLNADDVESFMYYTDPHLSGAEDWESRYDYILSCMGWVYDRVPVDFCLCGGDFLTNISPYNKEMSADQAFYCLEYSNLINQREFGENCFFTAFGNHDVNYQGMEQLSYETIGKAMSKDNGKTYYRFEGDTSDFYVLDTGRNWDIIDGKASYNVSMDSYKWEQINWLANELKSHDAQHNIIVMHIILNSNDEEDVRFCLYEIAYQLSCAYNERKTIVLNEQYYDFSSCSGKVEFFLGGHIHRDRISGDEYSIPFIIRRKLTPHKDALAFDCVLCDWSNRIVYFTRFGEGDSVTIHLN